MSTLIKKALDLSIDNIESSSRTGYMNKNDLSNLCNSIANGKIELNDIIPKLNKVIESIEKQNEITGVASSWLKAVKEEINK